MRWYDMRRMRWTRRTVNRMRLTEWRRELVDSTGKVMHMWKSGWWLVMTKIRMSQFSEARSDSRMMRRWVSDEWLHRHSPVIYQHVTDWLAELSTWVIASSQIQCIVCLLCLDHCNSLLYAGAAERDYDMQFWKEELVREINELEKSASQLEVRHRRRSTSVRPSVCLSVSLSPSLRLSSSPSVYVFSAVV